MVLVAHGGALEPVLLGDADHPAVGDIRHLLTLGPGGLGLAGLGGLGGSPEVWRRQLEDRERVLGLRADWGEPLSLDCQCEAATGSRKNSREILHDFVNQFIVNLFPSASDA